MLHKNKMFLNDSVNEFGTLCYSVETPRDEEMEHSFMSASVDAGLRLTDCNNQVNLDFSFHNEESYRKRLQKINRMIQALVEMRCGMNECYDDMLRLKEIKASNKTDKSNKETETEAPVSARGRIIYDSVQRDYDEAASRHNFDEDTFLDPDEVAE